MPRSPGRPVGPALEDALAILLSIGDGWRPSDLEFVKRFLHGMDYAQVAEQVGRDPSSTWRREKSLKMSQYFAARRLATFVAGCA